jgi:hypothetical protein
MNNNDTETLYPFRVTTHLKKYRSQIWKEIIERLLNDEASKEEKIGFSLMMVKLGGCVTCSADSFRAMRGCTHCASQTVRRYRGSDEELKKIYLENVAEVKAYTQSNAKNQKDQGN